MVAQSKSMYLLKKLKWAHRIVCFVECTLWILRMRLGWKWLSVRKIVVTDLKFLGRFCRFGDCYLAKLRMNTTMSCSYAYWIWYARLFMHELMHNIQCCTAAFAPLFGYVNTFHHAVIKSASLSFSSMFDATNFICMILLLHMHCIAWVCELLVRSSTFG